MKLELYGIAAALSFALAGTALAQGTPAPGSSPGTKPGGPAAARTEDPLDAEYKAAREKCATMKDNAKDLCMAEAKGKHRVARAEKEAQEKNTPRAQRNLALAKANAAYDVAKEKCDEQKAEAKAACVKEAKAARDSARQQAKAADQAGAGATKKSSPGGMAK